MSLFCIAHQFVYGAYFLPLLLFARCRSVNDMMGSVLRFPGGYHFVIITIPLLASFLVWESLFILSSPSYSRPILLDAAIV